MKISGRKTGGKIDRDVSEEGSGLHLSFVYTCGMADARENMQFELAAGNTLERL